MNDDLSKLMHDAVASVGGHAPAEQLAGRLAAVDRRRKAGVMLTAAMAMVLATVGVAAAWPEHQSPIRLEIGDEGVDDGDQTDGPDHAEPAPSPEPEAEASDEVAEEAVAPEPEIDFVVAIPTPTPTVVPEATPTPAPTAVPPTPTPPQAQPPASDNGQRAPHGDGGGGHADDEHDGDDSGSGHNGGEDSGGQGGGGEDGGGEEHAGGGEGSGHGDGESGGESGGQVAFTAGALYGSCEEPIPYDVYSGTAAPGATVTITSPWSATTTAIADGDGHWSAQVTFEAAPVGEPFTVTASAGGDSVSMSFVRTG